MFFSIAKPDKFLSPMLIYGLFLLNLNIENTYTNPRLYLQKNQLKVCKNIN